MGRASVSCTSVTRAKRTPPVHFAIRSVAKPWTQIESLWSMAATLARPGHENFVFGDLNAWTCARYKCRMKLFESVARNPRLPSLGLSVPWNRAVAQCYSTGERKLQYEKSINSWAFLCKEADRATTRHSFGRVPI